MSSKAHDLIARWRAPDAEELTTLNPPTISPFVLDDLIREYKELKDAAKIFLKSGQWINDEQWIVHYGKLMDFKHSIGAESEEDNE